MDQQSSPPMHSYPLRLWGNTWQEKLPVIIVGLVVAGIVAAFLISRGILKTPFAPQNNQPLTDEQKIQILHNLSSGSSGTQPTDQEKLQTLQQLNASGPNTTQPSDADKLKALQQLNGQ